MNVRILILLTLLAAASSADVTYDRLLHADREPQNWLSLLGQLRGSSLQPADANQLGPTSRTCS